MGFRFILCLVLELSVTFQSWTLVGRPKKRVGGETFTHFPFALLTFSFVFCSVVKRTGTHVSVLHTCLSVTVPLSSQTPLSKLDLEFLS